MVLFQKTLTLVGIYGFRQILLTEAQLLLDQSS